MLDALPLFITAAILLLLPPLLSIFTPLMPAMPIRVATLLLRCRHTRSLLPLPRYVERRAAILRCRALSDMPPLRADAMLYARTC